MSEKGDQRVSERDAQRERERQAGHNTICPRSSDLFYIVIT